MVDTIFAPAKSNFRVVRDDYDSGDKQNEFVDDYPYTHEGHHYNEETEMQREESINGF